MNYLNKAEKAIEYLAESEQEYARLKAVVKYAPERIKMYLATLVLESDKKTVAERTSASMAHPEYEQTINSFELISNEFYEIQERRNRAELTIEFWRSLNAAQKLGNPI